MFHKRLHQVQYFVPGTCNQIYFVLSIVLQIGLRFVCWLISVLTKHVQIHFQNMHTFFIQVFCTNLNSNIMELSIDFPGILLSAFVQIRFGKMPVQAWAKPDFFGANIQLRLQKM